MIYQPQNPLLSLQDVCLVPSAITTISSRSECNPFFMKGLLPLATAPMSCVLNQDNWELFAKEGILTVLPTTIPLDIRLQLMPSTFVSFSLREFEEVFLATDKSQEILESLRQNELQAKVCIDVANGHMTALLEACKKAKELFEDSIILMTGNIANPATYLEYARIGIDFVRVGIGTGSRCTTSANLGVHFPIASLLSSIRSIQISENLPYYPKIIADGGFKNFDEIIKAIALGADFVMCGKLFAQTEEACGQILEGMYMEEDGKEYKQREYFGMSTKIAQTLRGSSRLRTSEGISKPVPIKYSIKAWIENFKDYLTSAMSYSNSRTLSEFQANALVFRISSESRIAYFK